MAKQKSQKKALLEHLKTGDLLTPIKLEDFGSKEDPCFGQAYDLSTAECKLCGDSELCCLKQAENLGVTREELSKENTFKDIEFKIDKVGARKLYRRLQRADKSRKEIISTIMKKYELTKDEARTLYREFKGKK